MRVNNVASNICQALVTGVAPDCEWEIVDVGGGRRSDASHDADFLLTHKQLSEISRFVGGGVFSQLLAQLGTKLQGGDAAKRRGDFEEAAFAFHMVTDGNLHKFYEKIAVKDDLGGGGKVRGAVRYCPPRHRHAV